MNQILISASAPASASRLWQVVSDLQNPQRFNPYVYEADVIDRRSGGRGVERVCRLCGGGSHRERITDWCEGASYSGRIIQTPLPLKDGQYTLRLVPHPGEQRCTVKLELAYRLDESRIGDAAEARRWKHQLSEGMTRILRDLSLHACTDMPLKPVGDARP
ncbi:MAG: SRPBCC family protein [Phycisphaeraceae bacterium]|nr:SRPBCC family protein [Phycisphaeraceae bacterium]